jgi:hypothetical protein
MARNSAKKNPFAVVLDTTADETPDNVTTAGNEPDAPEAPEAEAPEAPPSNRKYQTVEQFVGKMAEFGAAFGQGKASKHASAMEMVRATCELDTAIDEKKAGEYYAAFQQAAATAQGRLYEPEASIKVQVSKFRSFIKLGKRVDFDPVEFMDDVLDVIADYRKMGDENPIKTNTYDTLVKVAVQQNKVEDRRFTKEELAKIMLPSEKADPTEIEEIQKVRKAVEKLHEKYAVSQAGWLAKVEEAYQAMGEALVDAGGTIADKAASKEEQEVQELMTKLAIAQARAKARTLVTTH